MGDFDGRHFRDETVVADGSLFVECTFERAPLVYRGGAPFFVSGSGSVEIRFEGPAENTLNTLRGLYFSGHAEAVEALISGIRAPIGTMVHWSLPANGGK